MDRDNIENTLLQRLALDFGLVDIDAETPLFTSGLLDSVHMLELVIIIDEAFGHSIPALQVSIDRFDSVARISQYLRSMAEHR